MFYILTYFTLSPLTPGPRVTLPGVRRSWHLDLIAIKNVDEIVPNNKNKYIFYLEFRKCLFASLAGRDELVCGAMVTWSSNKDTDKKDIGQTEGYFCLLCLPWFLLVPIIAA